MLLNDSITGFRRKDETQRNHRCFKCAGQVHKQDIPTLRNSCDNLLFDLEFFLNDFFLVLPVELSIEAFPGKLPFVEEWLITSRHASATDRDRLNPDPHSTSVPQNISPN